jgi:tripartite-type tricarboxylate transporter receptor subunit TctC
MRSTRRRIGILAATGFVTISAVNAFGLIVHAQSEEWPQRPVKIVVPFPPGGSIDGAARMIAQHLGEVFGKQFVVENHPGAGGMLAAESVAHAAADGYTLFLAALPQIAILPALTRVSYNPVGDFAPVSNVAFNPFVLTVNSNIPAKTLAEFVDYVRARPGKVAYASVGIGTLTHLSMALLLKRAGLEMIHVPYKGTSPMSEVVAGNVAAYFAPLSDAIAQGAGGSVRLLAVSSDHRASQIPDLPTVAESGYPGFRTVTWSGLMAPVGTPRPIIDRIAAEVAGAVRDSEFAGRLRAFGLDPAGTGPEEFAVTISGDIAFWGNVVREAGIAEQ